MEVRNQKDTFGKNKFYAATQYEFLVDTRDMTCSDKQTVFFSFCNNQLLVPTLTEVLVNETWQVMSTNLSKIKYQKSVLKRRGL